ncbi:hypothetical protein O3M35_013202 [Rhynocoris fuscipes]|uniref:BTB domain-containing protein n=1 Tax=Rhynocoris fuscipes TaxID=488301 RepID=A0AAW1CFF1_9HEMI
MDSHWQIKLNSLSERLNYLLNNQLFCDCEFIIDGNKMMCHKLILAASSPVFKAMFYGTLSKQSLSTQITDIEYDIFQQMIRYMYNNELILNSCKNACDLYLAAKKYMLEHLVQKCVSYLADNIDTNNALIIYEFAKYHNEENLGKLCQREIQVNTSQVLLSDSLIDISSTTFEMILDLKKLNISSELELFNALDIWAKHECERIATDNSRTVANSLLKKIRFLTLTSEEFINGPVHSELLNHSEKLEILLRIIKPDFPAMKNSLCDKRLPRKQLKLRCVARLDIREVHEARCDGTEWLTSVFTSNTGIDLQAIQVNLQISETDGYYDERILVKVSEASEQHYFAEGELNAKVQYNSKIEIRLNNNVTLEPFKEYAIHVFLCSLGLYPLGRHTNLTCDRQNVEIAFISHSSWERSHPCNTTVLNAIIYSDPLD